MIPEDSNNHHSMDNNAEKIEILMFKAVGRTTALLLKYPPEMTIVM